MKKWKFNKRARYAFQAGLLTAISCAGPTFCQSRVDSAPVIASDPSGGAKARKEAAKLYVAGARAVAHDDLEEANKDFTKALALEPQNHDYLVAKQIAQANLVTQLIQQVDKAKLLDRPGEARLKLLEASELAPTNPSVLQHLDPHNAEALDLPEDTGGVQLASAVQLQPDTSTHTFHIHGTGQELLKQVLTAYGITPSIDASVDSKRTSFDGDDISYKEAARMLQLATNSFFVPLDPKRVLIAKDTKANRDQFMRESVETVYLPGLTPSEMTDIGAMARTLFDAQQSAVEAQMNTMTIRAPQSRLTALNRTLSGLLEGRSQVDLDVRLIEVDTSRTTNVGVQLPQQFTAFNVTSELQSVLNSNQSLVQEVVSSGLAPAGDLEAILAVLIASGQISSPLLSGGYATFGNGISLTGINVPSVTANLALNSSKTKMLDDVHLQLQDQVAGNLMIGEKYPIETSSYSSATTSALSIPGVSTAGLSSELASLGLSGSAASAQPIPQVQYQDIGLQLKVTPHVLRSNDVSLDFSLKLQALAGASLNSIPELTNREFTATTLAKAGQTAIYASYLTKSETKAVTGVPGLSEIPGFQSTTDTTNDLADTTLLILITPRILRHEHVEMAGPVVMLPRHE